MLTVNSFLCAYSIEQGGKFIGWFGLLVAILCFYVNMLLIIGAAITTPDSLVGYFHGTPFQSASKEGETLELDSHPQHLLILKKFQLFCSPCSAS